MSDKTGIQWTDATWNPVSGCSKVSTGCTNCYAERDWARLSKNPKSPYFGRAFTDVKCHPERLDQPLRWRAPRRIFVNSMSDLFHESVPIDFLDQVFAVMAEASQHTFQILTKRPEWMGNYTRLMKHKLPNVWLGVSVENQATADERIPTLMETPAAVRFLSVEPLLERVDLGPIHVHAELQIDWVIVGGESGPNARPCNVDWIRSIVEQCKKSHVPVFVKQLGSLPVSGTAAVTLNFPDGEPCGGGAVDLILPLSDRHGGDPAEWPEDLRVREFPQ